MDNTRYRVVRPNPGLPSVGTILTGKDFVTSRRVQQLTEQRYILPLSGEGEGRTEKAEVENEANL